MPKPRSFLLPFVASAGFFGAQASVGAQPAATTPPVASTPLASTPAATTPPSPLSRIPILRQTLANGLRVVMSPERAIPTVAVTVYYDVGSRNEVRGRSGFAHLFEHMMFQGSANVRKGEHFQLVMNRGGTLNGTTSEDRTNYYETLPSNELALGLWLEADRMKSLQVTEQNFENQRQTVMEERRQRIDNQPYVPSFLRIDELAYGDYFPYSHSTIGDMQDLVNAPLSAVQEFFRTYYAPNNAVVSIAGDFDPTEAMAMVERYFGSIPRHEVPPFTANEMSPQSAEHTETMQDPNASLPAVHVAYHIPPTRTDDHYALETLALVLGDGESSRLYQDLVKTREICAQIYVGTQDRRGPDAFGFFAVMSADRAPSEARDAIFRALEDVTAHGITERELEKAKNRARSSFVFGIESNVSRSQRLGEYELFFGDANLLRGELDRYLAVTREDVQRVASRYFAASNRTVLEVLPPAATGADR